MALFLWVLQLHVSVMFYFLWVLLWACSFQSATWFPGLPVLLCSLSSWSLPAVWGSMCLLTTIHLFLPLALVVPGTIFAAACFSSISLAALTFFLLSWHCTCSMICRVLFWACVVGFFNALCLFLSLDMRIFCYNFTENTFCVFSLHLGSLV